MTPKMIWEGSSSHEKVFPLHPRGPRGPHRLPEGARKATVENIADDSTLNLRAQPSAGAEVLMRLYRHQELIVLEKSDVPGWVRVKTDVIEGYVMESYLVYADETPSPEPQETPNG